MVLMLHDIIVGCGTKLGGLIVIILGSGGSLISWGRVIMIIMWSVDWGIVILLVRVILLVWDFVSLVMVILPVWRPIAVLVLVVVGLGLLLLWEKEIQNSSGSGFPCAVGVVMIASENTTAVGSQVQVDQGFVHDLSGLICCGLERHQRVHVDGSNGKAIGAGVERVDGSSSAKGVLLITSVARGCLRKSKRESDGRLEGVVRNLEPQKATNIADKSLKWEKGGIWG